jgi:hypothetical protein
MYLWLIPRLPRPKKLSMKNRGRPPRDGLSEVDPLAEARVQQLGDPSEGASIRSIFI